MKQVILLGAPGSGKGTQAKLMVSELNFNHLSTGDLLRAEVAKKSDLGNRISDLINSGALVDDDTVLELLRVNIDLANGQYIFDGFPRNIEQAKALDKEVLGSAESKALYFDLDLSIIKERIINRRSCRDCGNIYNLLISAPGKDGVCDSCGGEVYQRRDDNAEVVENRLNVFKSTIDPVLEYYRGKGILTSLDASLSPDDVSTQIHDILG
ncbi:MAG: nucleoside monophosphate kinase [Bacteriovoracaceae bacterium]|nr:nucleoside monophosphate kinase [Bacteriovoracaceae bacterium]